MTKLLAELAPNVQLTEGIYPVEVHFYAEAGHEYSEKDLCPECLTTIANSYDGRRPSDFIGPLILPHWIGHKEHGCDHEPPECDSWYCSRGGPPCFGGSSCCICDVDV